MSESFEPIPMVSDRLLDPRNLRGDFRLDDRHAPARVG